MISSFQVPKFLILLGAACLAWAGLISVPVMFFMGTDLSTFGVAAGAVLLAALIWVAVMFREIPISMELPDFFATGERFGKAQVRDVPLDLSRPRRATADRHFNSRRGVTAWTDGGSRPRKVRSRRPDGSGAASTR